MNGWTEDLDDQVEVSEFTLGFETNSDSSLLELDSEVALSVGEAVKPVNGHGVGITLSNDDIPGCEDGEGTGHTITRSLDSTVPLRKASLNQIDSSSVEDGVVVTKAIVTIG